MRPTLTLLALGLFAAPRAEAEAQNCGIVCQIDAFLGEVGTIFEGLSGDASELFGMLEGWTGKAEEFLGQASEILSVVDGFVDSEELTGLINELSGLEEELGQINEALGISEGEAALFAKSLRR